MHGTVNKLCQAEDDKLLRTRDRDVKKGSFVFDLFVSSCDWVQVSAGSECLFFIVFLLYIGLKVQMYHVCLWRYFYNYKELDDVSISKEYTLNQRKLNVIRKNNSFPF